MSTEHEKDMKMLEEIRQIQKENMNLRGERFSLKQEVKELKGRLALTRFVALVYGISLVGVLLYVIL